MKLSHKALVLALPLVSASIGDNLPEFSQCLADCDTQTCSASSPSFKYAKNSVDPVSGTLFGWDCRSDCDYKCQQIVTDQRKAAGLPVVQFYGKWPFHRVLGVTEFYSTAFSMANFYVNYVNFGKLSRHYRSAVSSSPEKAAMLYQYLILLCVSMLGWTLSSVFHIRDFPLTETLDYAGASGISLANFNAIFMRYFGLYRPENKGLQRLFHVVLFLILIGHYTKLYTAWDYSYNMKFNVAFGLSASFLWIVHSVGVNRKYRAKAHIYSNSIYLLPHETRILAKLNYIGLSRSRFIPLIPVALNVFLLSAVLLEMIDFEPIFSLVDAHSLWHFCTIFPPIIWYDWNVWDLELASKS